MFDTLPESAFEVLDWSWEQYEPFVQELVERPLTSEGFPQWMADWSRLKFLIKETDNRLYVGTSIDTTDEEAEANYFRFLEEICPHAEAADQKLKEKLLRSGFKLDGFEIPLRNIRVEAEIFREENLPLLTKELKLENEYDKIRGAQTVEWEGKEITLLQLTPVYQEVDREKRERAWRLSMQRWLKDREAINELWGRFMRLRGELAANAGYDSFRTLRWNQLHRFDYTPEDSAQFQSAIEEVVVPAALRLYEKRRQHLGLDVLRPWDLDVDPLSRPPLRPFMEVNDLEDRVESMFQRVDPELSDYFKTMRQEGLLDLDNRKGKAPGGYCTNFPVVRRPFIFMNAVGLHDDVQTLLHEAGHCFHVFETAHLPYAQQLDYGLEIAEVASTAMELLAAPYLPSSEGGFYSQKDAARARIEFLEKAILFWPYMAVVDAFQHWVYENHRVASDPENCDAQWSGLWDRFMKGIDLSGMEKEKETGWHRKLHIHQVPFYYIEYGLAQLGAVQVWANSLADQEGALTSYRRMLSLGGTKSLPELFSAAGANFAFDAGTLGEAVDLMEKTIEELEAV
jgi:oligoendopeptidase F